MSSINWCNYIIIVCGDALVCSNCKARPTSIDVPGSESAKPVKEPQHQKAKSWKFYYKELRSFGPRTSSGMGFHAQR